MLFRILIFASLSLQLMGTFFLATQIIPNTWFENVKKNLQERHEKLVKITLTKRKQLGNLREDHTFPLWMLLISFIGFLLTLFVEPGDPQKILNESKKNYAKVKESPKGMAKILVSLIGILEGGIAKIGGARPLKDFRLFVFLIFGATSYLAYRFAILNELVQGINYSLIERITHIFSYFSQRQGEQIFAFLGIFLLAMGFIFQAIVNWLAIK